MIPLNSSLNVRQDSEEFCCQGEPIRKQTSFYRLILIESLLCHHKESIKTTSKLLHRYHKLSYSFSAIAVHSANHSRSDCRMLLHAFWQVFLQFCLSNKLYNRPTPTWSVQSQVPGSLVM